MKNGLVAVFALCAAVSAEAGLNSRSYVQDGLILQLDGVENSARGMPHDGALSTWNDLTGNHTLSAESGGSPVWGDDCLVFDGTNMKALLGSSPLAHAAMEKKDATVEICFEPMAGNSGYTVPWAFGSNEAYVLLWGNGMNLVNWPYARGNYATISSAPSGWLTATLRLASDKAYFLLDGEQKTQVSYGATTGNDNFTIGRMAHGYTTSYAKMKVYSFRVYDRALTPIEIKLNAATDQARFFGAEEKDYLVVSSNKGDLGTPSPAYGLTEANVGEIVCTAPEGVQTAGDGKRYVASGWRLRSVSKETGEETVLSGSGTTCRYAHGENTTDWLEWQFAPYVIAVSTVAELTAALADAQSGDVISAAAGTYQLAETLTVPSGVKLVSADGPATTTFKPAEDNPGVTALTVVGGTVAGFTIRDFQTTSTAVVYLKSSAVLSNCVVTANNRKASSDYGIVNINGATVSHCELYGNKGSGYCGPLSSNGGNCYVNYTLVVDNSGASYGGGVHMHAGNWWLNHCTIIGNSCTTMGSQIYNGGRGPNIKNCIIMNRPYHPTWYNWPDFGPYGGTAASSNPYFYNCLIPGIDTTVMKKTTSSGNLDLSDARFVFTGGRDYHLLADSPCIGAADDGGDIGCYPYDPDYKPTYATVDLKPTDDLLAALDAAADGTEIRLAPGEYVIDRFLNVTNRVRIIGVGGRDKTVIRPAGSGYRLLRQSNYYSQVAGITFLGATNTTASAQDEIYYWQNGGGGVALRFGDFHDNRVTQCRDTRGGAAMYCVGGWVNRCLIDRNSGSAAVVLCGVNNGLGYTYCTFENSLICENDNPNGAAVQTTTPIAWSSYTNESSAQGFKNCTVINNTTRYAVQRGTKGSVVYNTILRNAAGSAYEPWYDSAANAETATSPSSTVWRCCASTSAVGTNCTVAADLKVRASGKLAWASPCRNAGFLYRMTKEPTATDYFGGPRVVSEPGEDPTIDIGCCQLSGFPPGLLMLVR